MLDSKTKFKLFKQNKIFCSAPWNLLYVATDGTVKTCTRGNTYGDLKQNTVEEIVTNHKYKSLREDILKDRITSNCRRCLNFENVTDAGKFDSLRNLYNELNIESSVDYTNAEQFKLTALDLHWSSVCNLKCITCWHEQSSSIAREQNMPVKHTPPAVADKLIDYIVSNQTELREIYLSGGEPTLIKYNLKLLRLLEKNSNLSLRVNTNLQWDTSNSIIQEILKFPNVLFTCSIDGIGDKFNYIRRGANWDRTVKNLEFLKAQSNVKLRVNTVFFVLTGQELPDIIDYFMEDIGVMDCTINQIEMGHDDLRCRNYTPDIKSIVRSRIERCFDKYVNHLNISGNLKNCLNEIEQNPTDSYKNYLDHIDSLQGTDWNKLWPELL